MKIILNNNPETIDYDGELTIDELLKLKKFSFKMLVIKINGRLIKKEDYSTAIIQNDDNVAIIHLISGG